MDAPNTSKMAFICNTCVLASSFTGVSTNTRSVQARRKVQLASKSKRAQAHVQVQTCSTASASDSTMSTTGVTTTLKEFLEAASNLGTIRFVNISKGAVLEAIGRFDYDISVFELTGKGKYVTVASEDKTFECHINADKVEHITMGRTKAKVGDHELYVIRFLGAEDAVVLSCLLMWNPAVGPGSYLHGAVESFEALRQRFGDRFAVAE